MIALAGRYVCSIRRIQGMKQIDAAEFKEKCLSLLDRVDETGIIITKRGKPVAKLIAVRAEGAELIGRLRGKVKIKGDILSTRLKWSVVPLAKTGRRP